jgi:hypothetical protein
MGQGVLVVALFVPVGCSTRPATETGVAAEAPGRIREVYDLLVLHEEQKKHPAHAVQDLRPYENAYPGGYALVHDGKVSVCWGAPATGAESILAFEKQAPAEGGWVVFQGGAIKRLTADEFRAAPQATKK